MRFKWNLQQPEFSRYKKEQHEYDVISDSNGEYLGSVRCGDLCFDIINWGDHLWFDLYVGGVDTGYGYGADDYPYDYCDIASFSWYEDLTNISNDVFKYEIEQYIIAHLKEYKEYVTDMKSIHVDLLEKANEELNDW